MQICRNGCNLLLFLQNQSPTTVAIYVNIIWSLILAAPSSCRETLGKLINFLPFISFFKKKCLLSIFFLLSFLIGLDCVQDSVCLYRLHSLPWGRLCWYILFVKYLEILLLKASPIGVKVYWHAIYWSICKLLGSHVIVQIDLQCIWYLLFLYQGTSQPSGCAKVTLFML